MNLIRKQIFLFYWGMPKALRTYILIGGDLKISNTILLLNYFNHTI